MWSKFTNALKPRPQHQEEHQNTVFEQQSNSSTVTLTEPATSAYPEPPPSPSKSAKLSVLRRLSRQTFKEDGESSKSASLRIPGLPKKSKSEARFNTLGSGSQLSLTPSSVDQAPSPSLTRSNSMNMLGSSSEGPSKPPSKPSVYMSRHPSLDLLRSETTSRPSQDSPRPTLGVDTDMPPTPGYNGSVRSILRGPNTPGTGQNVRFFSRDAYKVISPNQSMEHDGQTPTIPTTDPSPSFLESLQNMSPESTSTPYVPRGKATTKVSRTSRPTVAEVFSPLHDDAGSSHSTASGSKEMEDSDMSLVSAGSAEASTNIFDVSHPLDLQFDPQGMGFDTSTPLKFREEASARKEVVDVGSALHSSPPPTSVDETIFYSHGPGDGQRLSAPLQLHDRSQSVGGSAFFSAAESASHTGSTGNPFKNNDNNKEATSISAAKSRTRPISDSMLQNLLRPSPKVSAPPPEADINDGRADNVQVRLSATPPPPDPFSPFAKTYYTPQVNIPPTPPRLGVGFETHVRNTSKEENMMYSLQTQLALQTELCQQYEADLRARDELVELVAKKLADANREEARRQANVRTWKKRVNDLQKMCRHLEEEVDGSRRESMDRSIMDEASGEALRMLHRQIAALEREKGEMVKREQMMKEEIETLEAQVKDKSTDVHELQEMLWNREEGEQGQGMKKANAQGETGRLSIANIDEEELRKLKEETEAVMAEESDRHRAIETQWEQEKQELTMKLEGLHAEQVSMEEELDKTKQRLKARDDEFDVLRAELESQWANTESMTSKQHELEQGKLGVEQERDELRHHVEDLEARITDLEMEWDEGEKQRVELQAELDALRTLHAAVEKDRDQIDYELQQEQERAEHMVQERDQRITQLEQELQHFQEDKAHQDEELESLQRKVDAANREAESLREELSNLGREFNRLLDDQSRMEQDTITQDMELKSKFENAESQKAASESELKTAKDQVAALKEETDRLRRHVQTLQQESADKEVKVANLEKQKAMAKSDIMGLNIALDSKQQELDLMKRQLGVRGTAGMTPAPSKAKSSRRDSAIFTNTPATVRRPSSVLSDSDAGTARKVVRKVSNAERPGSAASVARPPSAAALARSSRANAPASTSTSAASRTKGAMSPPPSSMIRTGPRPSISSVTSGTPTPRAKRTNSVDNTSTRSSSVVSPTGTPLPARKVSNTVSALEGRAAGSSVSAVRSTSGRVGRMTSPVQGAAGQEKENVEDVGSAPSVSARRRVMLPS